MLCETDLRDAELLASVAPDTSSLGSHEIARRWSQPPPQENGAVLTINVRVAIKSISKVSTVDGTAFVRVGIVYYWTDCKPPAAANVNLHYVLCT